MEHIKSLEQALHLLKEASANETSRNNIAVHGMYAHVKSNMPDTSFYRDSLQLINQLAFAKYKIDCACSHSLPVVKATSELMLLVQELFAQEVIPCTEWPTPSELLDFIQHHIEIFQNNSDCADESENSMDHSR
ncbi:MAG: hypothetical protein OEZ39_15620 [Gammaproteobacteria bacterium]|nr:hypothetical protein [Gammaproteobacteria bacterium]MDH5653285.1 hypothetical protein [Gammaproteobacteria bacterium]